MGIILASSSPRRRELMALITPDYTVRTSDVDERAIRAETPALLAQKLAAAKCRAVAESCPEDVVIGCDTVVDVDGAVFGKPADRDDARRMIRVLAGRGHLVHTGVCIAAQGRELCFAATTKVVFDALSDAEIEAYIATDDPYDKAGGLRRAERRGQICGGYRGLLFQCDGLPGVPCVQCAERAGRALSCLNQPVQNFTNGRAAGKKGRRNRKAGGRLAFFCECAKKFCCTNSFFVIY